MSRPPQQLSFSHLITLGFRQSASLAPATLSLAAARAVGSLAVMLISWSLLEAFLSEQLPVGLGIAGGLLVLWLTAELIEGVVLAGALRQGRQRMLGTGIPTLLEAILHEARRGLTFPLWLGALQLFRSVWRWGALLGGITLYIRAFEGQGSGLVASIALALAVVLPLLFGLLLIAWLRVGLVQAIHEEQSVSAGLFEAVGLLRWELGVPLLIILLYGLFSFFGEGLVTTVVTPLSSLRDASPLTLLRLASLTSLMVACVGAIPVMLFEHAGWQGLMAWRLAGSGMLPPEALPTPRPVRVHQAKPALAGAGATGGMATIDAIPAGPAPRPSPSALAMDGGPIVEARPTGGRAPDDGPIVEAVPTGRSASDDGAVVQALPVSSPSPVEGTPSPRVGESDPAETGAGTDGPENGGTSASAASGADPADKRTEAPDGPEKSSD